MLFTQEIRFVELHTRHNSGPVSYLSARIRRKEGDETPKPEIKSRRGRSSLWAACMSTAGLNQSLQIPAYCYVPILPKWSRPPSLRIVTISRPQSFCIFTSPCYWQKTVCIFPEAESSKDVFFEA